MKKVLFSLSLFVMTLIPAIAIQETETEKQYYLNDCIKIALNNSPIIKDKKYKLQIAGTDVSIAKANYFPTFHLGVGYWQGFNSEKTYDDGYTKWILPSVGAYVEQLIYDFGKTGSTIAIQEFYKKAAEYAFIDSICETINNVKLKYFMVLAAQYEIEIQENNLEINKIILNRTKEKYDKGEKEEIDLLNAQIYYSSAKIDLEKANNLYKNALEDLYSSMYILNSDSISIKKIDTFDYYDAYFTPEFLKTSGHWHELKHRQREKDLISVFQPLPFDIDYAQKEAFKNSPDLKILDFTLDAMKKALSYTKKQYFPTLKGSTGYEFNNRYKGSEDITRNNNQLNLSVKLESSLNIGKQVNQTKQANYKVKIAENNIELYKINLYHNVKKSYIDVETAQKQILTAIEKAKTTQRTLEIVSSSYASNSPKISYIDLQLARQNYNNAKLEYISQLRNYNVALAQVERLVHNHDKSYFEYAYEGVDKKILPKEIQKML